MDVYLSRDALEELEALRLAGVEGEGILRGHRRGRRYFVEHTLAVPGILTAPESRLRQLMDFFQDAFLGFFMSRLSKQQAQNTKNPQSMGKILLETGGSDPERPEFRAWVVEFNGEFKLEPLKIKNPKAKPRGKA